MKQQNYPLKPTLCLEILTVTIPRKDMIMEPPSFSTKLQKNERVQFWTRSFWGAHRISGFDMRFTANLFCGY